MAKKKKQKQWVASGVVSDVLAPTKKAAKKQVKESMSRPGVLVKSLRKSGRRCSEGQPWEAMVSFPLWAKNRAEAERKLQAILYQCASPIGGPVRLKKPKPPTGMATYAVFHKHSRIVLCIPSKLDPPPVRGVCTKRECLALWMVYNALVYDKEAKAKDQWPLLTLKNMGTKEFWTVVPKRLS